MVARLQQDLVDIRAESRLLRTPGVQPVVHTPQQVAFTTTKVSRFGGTTSWEQYRQVFDAIVLSNWWDDATAWAGPPRAGRKPPQPMGWRGPELSFHLRGGRGPDISCCGAVAGPRMLFCAGWVYISSPHCR